MPNNKEIDGLICNSEDKNQNISKSLFFPENRTKYRNFRSFTRTADYPHRPIIAYSEKKSHQITRTGG